MPILLILFINLVLNIELISIFTTIIIYIEISVKIYLYGNKHFSPNSFKPVDKPLLFPYIKTPSQSY